MKGTERILAGMFAVITLYAGIGSAWSSQPGRFRIQPYSVEDGLSQSSIWCMMQDRQGFLWFGTADGLNRFDGYSFKVYRRNPADSTSLANNTIWSLYEDRGGSIWVGTVAGVHRFDRASQRFTRLADQRGFKGTCLEEIVYSILEDRTGRVWLATSKGIACLEPASGILRQFSTTEIPHSRSGPAYRVLHEDGQGDIWVANGEGLFRFEHASGMFVRQQTVGEGISFLHSCKDHDGVYWFATNRHGLMSFDPRSRQWRNYRHDRRNPTSIPGDELRSVCEDQEGRIWCGTIYNGLAFLDRATGRFSSVLPAQQGILAGKNARYEGASAILRDRSGLIWVGYDGAGLLKINPYRNKFHHVLLPQSNSPSSGDNFFKAICVDHRGNVWLGMYDQGISVLDRTTGHVRRYRHRLRDDKTIADNTVLSLFEDTRNAIWIGTVGGLDELGSSGRILHHDLSAFATEDRRWKIINAIAEDSEGTLWVGTATHLLKSDRLRKRFKQVLSSSAFGLTLPPAISAVAPAPDGTLWVGTLGAGALHIHPDGTILRRLVHVRGSTNSLSHNNVKTILIDPRERGILWVGTEEGLNRYDVLHDRWRTYWTADGLPNEFIYGLLMDNRGRLWISTNKGISRLDASDPDHPKFRNYTPDDGLQSYEFNTNAYCKSDRGEMFFGGINGFNTFFPDSVTDNPYEPSIVLTGFKKFDLPVQLAQDIGLAREVRLSYDESVFSIEFAALEFSNPIQNRYAYRMDGVDKGWVYNRQRREARYTHLDPGEYLFRVKGSNNDGVWSETSAPLRIIIVPPFWRTTWFVGMMALLAIGTFGGTVRFMSIRKLKKKVEELEREKAIHEERLRTREQIARDLHDDLASTVGSAGFFIESIKNQLKDIPSQTREFLDKTSSLLTEAEETMSDIVWSVSPKHDTLLSLLARIRLTTADLCRATQVKHEVLLAKVPATATVPEEVRRNLYLIFKEALTNAVRHSGATHIRVAFSLSGEYCELSVEDDGKGLPPPRVLEPTNRGHGLRNMMKRAEEIGFLLSIGPGTDCGTVVLVKGNMTQASY